MILSLTLAILIGFTLGILGGGGSILTVPILVYILKMDPKLSIALSLAIVGVTALFGSFGHYKKGNLSLKVALSFAPFAMVGTFAGSKIAAFMSAEAQLIAFSIIMLLASFFMFKGRKGLEDKSAQAHPVMIAIMASAVGVLTGIVGVGGGFLIVPALVLLARVEMKKAVGTSLFIIALNSMSGFSGYMSQFEIPWKFLLTFSSFTVIGIFIGTHCIQYVSQQKLKKIFAIFLIFMGSAILYKNLV